MSVMKPSLDIFIRILPLSERVCVGGGHIDWVGLGWVADGRGGGGAGGGPISIAVA